jgi:hypothetical protein
MTQKSVHKSAGAIVFAVPPGFVARVSAQPHDLTFGQVGSITTASRLSLHGPEGRSVSSSRVIFAGATSRGSHYPPIALPAPSSYSSLSQHLQHRVYFRAGAYCNCSWVSRAFACFVTRKRSSGDTRRGERAARIIRPGAPCSAKPHSLMIECSRLTICASGCQT